MEKPKSKNEKATANTKNLIELVFSWSLADVLNENLYKNQVKKIPDTFLTSTSYKKSFISPLIEETHANLLSSMLSLSHAPTCEILSVGISEDYEPPDDLFYDITYKRYTETVENHKGLIYEPQVGDIIALTNVRPNSTDDLNRPPRFYHIAYVHVANDIDKFPDDLEFTILSSKLIDSGEPDIRRSKRETLFAVFLINLTTNVRIWNALISNAGNTNIINKVLQPNSDDMDSCSVCSEKKCSTGVSAVWPKHFSHNLNKSQEAAVLNCIDLSQCHHQNSVKLIWGPPGTGKTKTMSLSLFALFHLKCRTLTCAPTNIAVLEVAARLRRLVNQSFQYGKYGLGDIVLVGNKKRMEVDNNDDLRDIFLDNRVQNLIRCLVPLSGWRQLLESMIFLLDNPEEQYSLYLEERAEERKRRAEERKKRAEERKKGAEKRKKKAEERKKRAEERKKGAEERKEIALKNEEDNGEHSEDQDDPLPFVDFVKNKFDSIGEPLKTCMVDLYTHLPTSCISLEVVKAMVTALDLLKSIKSSLHTLGVANEGSLKLVLKDFKVPGSIVGCLTQLRTKCVSTLKSLPRKFSLPSINELNIRNFYLENACLIFCTASSSAKLQIAAAKRPLRLLVIDEAAQLKESESAIPLQLHGLRHAILVGDEKQLPAMIESKISEKAGFGRSMFQRLAVLGHKKHLLNVQYRMHPTISLFPNREFYGKQILNGPNVIERSYERSFLKGKMFQSYSFINIVNGKEEFDYRYSRKNMVEVSVVCKIVSSLYKEFTVTKKNVSIGVISPYKAQVHAIQEMLKKYSTTSVTGFSVSVRSVDGFQGGEEDVIIISTVRCNGSGSVGFLFSRERTNVAITRARYCLWILGSGSTLINSGSIWKKLVLDAKKRNCFYNAEEDNNLAQATVGALLELNQLHSLLDMDSLLFKNTIWKVYFTNEFQSSISNIKDCMILQEVLSLLTKLANGWRQYNKDKGILLPDRTSAQLLEKYKIREQLNLIWTVDIIKENAHYLQVMKFWDVVPFSHIPEIEKRLDIDFRNYTEDKMNRCKEKYTARGIVVPGSWPVDFHTCPEADHMEFLSKPLSSLSLTDKRETSTSIYRETVKEVEPINHCRLSFPKISLKSNVNDKQRSAWKAKVGGKDFNNCIEADPVEFISKSLYSLSLTDKPGASASTDMETKKEVTPARSCLSAASESHSKIFSKKKKKPFKKQCERKTTTDKIKGWRLSVA